MIDYYRNITTNIALARIKSSEAEEATGRVFVAVFQQEKSTGTIVLVIPDPGSTLDARCRSKALATASFAHDHLSYSVYALRDNATREVEVLADPQMAITFREIREQRAGLIQAVPLIVEVGSTLVALPALPLPVRASTTQQAPS
jgi:hypothetical protein